jgi:hypothetical protein
MEAVHLLMPALLRQSLCRLHRLLRLDREFIESNDDSRSKINVENPKP